MTQDVLKVRNLTTFDFESYWVTIPKQKNETTEDFQDLNSRKKCCLNTVESVRYAYLVKTEFFPEQNYRSFFENSTLNGTDTDPNARVDDIFCYNLRNKVNFTTEIYILNDKTYGQLVNLNKIDEKRLRPELTRIMENHDLWERRYIQEKIIKTTTKNPDEMPEILPKDTVLPGNCHDTYQLPMFTQLFADHWIQEAEHEDNWFNSGNHAVYDERFFSKNGAKICQNQNLIFAETNGLKLFLQQTSICGNTI